MQAGAPPRRRRARGRGALAAAGLVLLGGLGGFALERTTSGALAPRSSVVGGVQDNPGSGGQQGGGTQNGFPSRRPRSGAPGGVGNQGGSGGGIVRSTVPGDDANGATT